MFIVDVALKNNPVPISVQRKSDDDAKALYQQIVEAIQSGNPVTIELSCEQQAGKTVCVLVSEIAAVQMAEKSGSATSSGRPPGFFALAEQDAQQKDDRLKIVQRITKGLEAMQS